MDITKILIKYYKTVLRTVRSVSIPGIIKRTITLAAIVAICVAAFLSIRGTLPFMPVFGTSMEPVLHAGDMIIIEDVSAKDVEVGDIIVFSVPEQVREFYNYPMVVAHRVKTVRDGPTGLTFRTQGDNTGEDPFSVRPQDLRGQVSKQISYLGFPLLFFQSQQGLIFVVIALILLAFYLYADELIKGRVFIHKSVFSPVIKETQRSSQALEKRIESTEKGNLDTQQALTSFASAISEYAEHLKSHTGAIQGLSDASQELKKGAAQQNEVLARLLDSMEQGNGGVKKQEPQMETKAPEIAEEPQMEAGESKVTEEIPEITREVPDTTPNYPPGCFKSRTRLILDENGDVPDAG